MRLILGVINSKYNIHLDNVTKGWGEYYFSCVDQSVY